MERSPQKHQLPEGYSYHSEGYLWHVLPVEVFSELPETVTVENETLIKKSEFHVTVVNSRAIARDLAGDDLDEIAKIEEHLQVMLSKYVRDTPIEFVSFEDDLRLAVTEERTSIAARCQMKNVEGYFERITSEYGKEYPIQPPHVSLYTRNGAAVGIDSIEQIESYKKVQLPEVQNVLSRVSAIRVK